ncbi:MAG: cell division protein FtsH [Opitutia bacterium TMED67]|mgnify:FL=1|nr:cell division protein FtsH [Verrucomicrobiales bacterium]OUU71415.1 MAG: cell division protein FtsH [Opitutae bacterium TMED67]RZO55283.1 MAG: ATP-dependent zinc metalloprotease FtsH [Limisphaerales bacterium]|tara:strand:- start:2065 stop:4074 length:2010 start_codon:yes stop_codon:yes gene_type:complete
MADNKPPKINENKPKSEDKFPNPRSWMLWALGIFMVVMLFQIGSSAGQDPKEKVNYDMLQEWINSGADVKGFIEYPPPNSSALCTITGYRIENGNKVPFEFEDKLIEGRERFLIEEAGFQPKNKSTLLTAFLIQLLPILLIFLLIWFVLIRQIRSAGKGAMSFGKSKAKMLNKDKNKTTFKDVAGVEEACEEVSELVDYLKDPKKFQKLGGKIPKGILMVGPPGTGKTLLARAIAGEADAGFFSISGSDFVEMFVGVGASRVRDMFEQARKSTPCLVFIDEIDAVGRSRGHGLGGGNDEREQTLNALLVEMDGFDTQDGIIIIAATNRPDVLDPALLRPGRFDRQLTVNLPDIRGREDILKVHAKNVKLSELADLSVIARGTPGFSGAELANLLNEAALLAARTNKKSIGMIELEEARDKVRWGRERRSLAMTDEDKKITAWHEAGHAIINVLLDKCHPLHKVTIIPRGQALGATMSLPKDDVLNRQSQEMCDTIAMTMGGRIAEEILTGDISTGAAGDIQQATNMARAMVTQWGMSKKLGMVLYGEGDEYVFLGKDLAQGKTYSEQTAQEIDTEVRRLVDEGYQRASKLISDNRDKLELIANALLEYETLDGQQVEDIVRTGKFNPPKPPNDVDPPKGADAATPTSDLPKKDKPSLDEGLGDPAPATP